MEILKNTNFDFLGKKWPFIILSLVLLAASVISLLVKGPHYGIDFRGGAVMNVLFSQEPPIEKIRSVLSAKIPGEISVVNVSGSNEVIIGTQIQEERSLEANRQTMVATLQSAFGGVEGKLDVNNAGASAVADRLRDPFQRAGIALSEEQLQSVAKTVIEYKDTQHSGLLTSFDQLSGAAGVTPQMIQVMKQELALSSFTIRQTDVVGPKVGADLQRTAILATLYALGGMLVYIAFRFEWIYGVAAVIAVAHDTIITVGLFSIFNREIDLTVVAALLTLVGYSMNDTIVIFDRIRENLKLLRREKYTNLVNLSVNQTLSRTIMTSGLTFLTALALYLFGGRVLNNFAFALVVGILIGTYSSVFIASPIVVFWQDMLEKRKRTVPAAVTPVKETAARKPVKTR